MIRGDRLRELRIAKGLSATEAAKELKMSQPQLLNYENGKTDPSTHALARMMTFYGVAADYLLGITDMPDVQRLSAEEVALISALRNRNWIVFMSIATALIVKGGVKPEELSSYIRSGSEEQAD
jgi:transcriptional regulator with XRE-family HTH domain